MTQRPPTPTHRKSKGPNGPLRRVPISKTTVIAGVR